MRVRTTEDEEGECLKYSEIWSGCYFRRIMKIVLLLNYSKSFKALGRAKLWRTRVFKLKRLHLKELTSRPVGLSFHRQDVPSLFYVA